MRSRSALVAGALMVLAMPVASWWVIGDQSEPIEDPDYAFRPLDISPGTERAAGLIALFVVLFSGAFFLFVAGRHQMMPGALTVLGPLLLAGVVVGYSWRIMTAGVGGANIGAGFALFFGPPIVLTLVIVSVVCAFRLRRG
jgi:hypothetical protein